MHLLRKTLLLAMFAAVLTVQPAMADDGGASPGSPLPPIALGKPTVAGSKIVIRKGVAYAPLAAPEVVKQVVWAGNRIRAKRYLWGGGHGAWIDSGYDCSGSVGFALHGAGLLNTTLVSGEFASWGKPGKGKWITIYANGGHVYMQVAGARFDTSGANPSRWQSDLRSGAGFTVRHPANL